MIYLYTLYADIAPYADEPIDTPEFRQKRERAAARDAILRKWLLDNDIGPFPKSNREAERLKPRFADYSRRNPMLYIVFRADDERCSVLNRGAWTTYPDLPTATREIYSVPAADRVIFHRNIVFSGGDGGADP